MFFLELEKYVNTKHWDKNKMQQKKKKKKKQTNNTEKRYKKKIQDTLSSAKKGSCNGTYNTKLGKLDGVWDGEKLKADNIIPFNLLDRTSPLKVHSCKEFEKNGRLSWNRATDTKDTCIV